MLLRRVLVASAVLAQLATMAIVSIHIVLSRRLAYSRTIQALSSVSATLESLTLVLLIGLFSSHILPSVRGWVGRRQRFVFGVAVFACASAAASVATVICLAREADGRSVEIDGMDPNGMLIAASLALGLSFAFQFLFLITHYISSQSPGGARQAFALGSESRYPPKSNVKGIRYSQTTPLEYYRPRGNSVESRYADSSNGSLASSVSHAMRSSSSKTKLLSTREKRRDSSLDSNSHRRSADVSDAWDMSDAGLDPPKGRFLETIPASPTISRTPSPVLPDDLELPMAARRSRSYSPVARTRTREPPERTNSSSSELHIHPLFRSDSPTPPPLATPGTVVLAAPQAGHVIVHRESIKSLRRMRSGSLPTAPSPLSRQGSFDRSCSSSLKRHMDEQRGIKEVDELDELDDGPIPQWVLGAGIETRV
ncbi:hypothetical protein S7711_07685 [Stachybotrys chartarum IBT 7711]|uniref:Uncharacterized protein n=1 Tax=Stachybotrys chartarum (strain CBS 109288 / IBT 7711) TaxID=1280523 RepID=A0A084AWG6_STACB|nr:hypothetical protein S7711_07685 [Stachybotrys chartarum IBT 7711]KFA51977.1 hypothetical protein S40293_07734 [Stachybotrys chartarum IBT 40293]KFA80192.1 hypothetical protein S40288_07315 [Stachybotrys chartarum IBT 40288]